MPKSENAVFRLPELRLRMTHSQKLTAKTKPRLRMKMESINTKLYTILGQLFSFNSSEWFFLGTSILGLLKPLKEHPHRPRKMAAKNGWYFTRKKCTWYHIFWIFNNIFVKYCYFPFTVKSVMSGIALLPFENGRNVCDFEREKWCKVCKQTTR